MGVLHLHLAAGEPLSRRDLEALVEGARAAGLYTNLITSGIGLTERRLKALEAAGLDHVQLSLQGTDVETGRPDRRVSRRVRAEDGGGGVDRGGADCR